jgi:hypothetical protein
MREPGVKRTHARIAAVNKNTNKEEFEMARITAVIAVMCAVCAFVSYPSAEERRQSAMETISPLAMMQTARVLPAEAYDAI